MRLEKLNQGNVMRNPLQHDSHAKSRQRWRLENDGIVSTMHGFDGCPCSDS